MYLTWVAESHHILVFMVLRVYTHSFVKILKGFAVVVSAVDIFLIENISGSSQMYTDVFSPKICEHFRKKFRKYKKTREKIFKNVKNFKNAY